MQYALDSIVKKYELEYDVTCEVTSGASGLLYSQIENGAPYHLFLSANMTYPQTLHKNGVGDQPFIFAKGQLLFVTQKESQYLTIQDALNDSKITRVALADTKIAPFGMATFDYLSQSNLYEKLKEKLVVGENVGQVNLFLVTKAVEAGFTGNAFKVKYQNEFNYFELDSNLYHPINQSVIVLNKNASAQAKRFVNFLCSDESKSILRYFGYLAD